LATTPSGDTISRHCLLAMISTAITHAGAQSWDARPAKSAAHPIDYA
jgi:hypothetical protein